MGDPWDLQHVRIVRLANDLPELIFVLRSDWPRTNQTNIFETTYAPIIIVGNPSGVPGKSHVCSNVDETAPRCAAVSFALDSLSDGVSSVQINPSSTFSPQVESCSLG